MLGRRLEHCTELALAIDADDATLVFGSPDDLKFRSSMTLFARAGGAPVFRQALDRYFGGRSDDRTLRLLAG